MYSSAERENSECKGPRTGEVMTTLKTSNAAAVAKGGVRKEEMRSVKYKDEIIEVNETGSDEDGNITRFWAEEQHYLT